MLNDIIQNRKKKLDNFTKKGTNPYPDSSARTHTTSRVLKEFETLWKSKKEIVLAGRIRSVRGHGGSTFIHIEDASGLLQAYLKQDLLGKENYSFFQNFDIGR